jgi:hypothetical protein
MLVDERPACIPRATIKACRPRPLWNPAVELRLMPMGRPLCASLNADFPPHSNEARQSLHLDSIQQLDKE